MKVLLCIVMLTVVFVEAMKPFSFELKRKTKSALFSRNPRNTHAARKVAKKVTPTMFRDFPLRGNWTAIALWYMTIDVGPSAQTFHVQVDTGSSDIGIPTASCKCGQHLDAPWDPSKDAGASPAKCQSSVLICSGDGAKCKDSQCAYTISYEDGSGYSASIYNDTVILGSQAHQGYPLRSQYIGGITSEVTPNGPFEPVAVDGIAGFAQQFLSVVNAPTLVDTLNSESGCPLIFSMCGDVNHQGGVITFCGAGTHYSGALQWTPMVEYNQGFYNIYGVDMAVNGKRLNIPSRVFNDGMVTVDSGTTAAYFPGTIIKALKSALLADCSNNHLVGLCGVPSDQTVFDGYCFSMTQAEVNQYPNITFFAGQSNTIPINFPGESYIVAGFCNDPAKFSSSFQNGGGDDSGVLLGDPIMIANEVVYDVENKRMGFAPKLNCLYPGAKK